MEMPPRKTLRMGPRDLMSISVAMMRLVGILMRPIVVSFLDLGRRNGSSRDER